MKQGDYVEIEGHLHISHYDRPVVVAGKTITEQRPAYEIRATQVRRLDYPSVGIDEGEDG